MPYEQIHARMCIPFHLISKILQKRPWKRNQEILFRQKYFSEGANFYSILSQQNAFFPEFFFLPTPLGFRQVVPHIQLHVAKNR